MKISSQLAISSSPSINMTTVQGLKAGFVFHLPIIESGHLCPRSNHGMEGNDLVAFLQRTTNVHDAPRSDTHADHSAPPHPRLLGRHRLTNLTRDSWRGRPRSITNYDLTLIRTSFLLLNILP